LVPAIKLSALDPTVRWPLEPRSFNG
jgi:hypothetical protein